MIQVFWLFFQYMTNEYHWSKVYCCKQFNTCEGTKKSNFWFRRLWFVCSRGKDIILHRVTPVTIELKMEIPHGYFGKIYPRSSLLNSYFVSCSAGGTFLVLMTNNSNVPLVVNGQRIVQIVFHKKRRCCF